MAEDGSAVADVDESGVAVRALGQTGDRLITNMPLGQTGDRGLLFGAAGGGGERVGMF